MEFKDNTKQTSLFLFILLNFRKFREFSQRIYNRLLLNIL